PGREAVSVRSGSQSDSVGSTPGPGITYSGNTPNDVSLSGVGWLSSWFGIGGSAGREAFALFANGTDRVATASLLRVDVGPTGRYVAGPLSVELLLGPDYAQLPAFTSSSGSPTLLTA